MSGTSDASDRYVYQVHPSYKSQTAIKIVRKLPPTPPLPSSQKIHQNPYVFKPKSYSRKSNLRQRQCSPHVIPPATKKFKFNNSEGVKLSNENELDKKYIFSELSGSAQNYFTWSVRDNQKMKDVAPFEVPLNMKRQTKNNLNEQLTHKIQIVSTKNQKILAPIHQGLLKANINHSKNEQTLQGLVNPFNSQLKREYAEKIPFVRDYKSGYTPIELQNQSNKQEEKEQENRKEKNQSQKVHFIKKKQSTLSLSRTCGVSYIKPSQSVQTGPFDDLPPLIFQCSTSCNYTNQLKEVYHSNIEKLIYLSENRWLPAIMTTQQHMRSLLLGKPFGKAVWIQGIQNIWPLLNEGIFLLVFFNKEFAETEQQIWSQFHSCYFKFGILSKKSTSGRKLFMKSIQPDYADKTETTSIPSFDNIQENTNKSTIIPSSQPKLPNADDMIDVEKSESKQDEEKKMEESPSEERKQCKDIYDSLFEELKNSRTVITMSLKFEMYVEQKLWKNQNKEGKNILNAIIHSFEENLQKKSISIIRDRFQLLNKQQRSKLLNKAIQKIRFGNFIDSFEPQEEYIGSVQNIFNLETLDELNQSLQEREYAMDRPLIAFNELYKDKDGKENIAQWQKSLKMPIYFISTRDSFAFDLIEKITVFEREGRPFKKIEYFFEPDNIPDNYGDYKKLFPNFETGVVCYHDFFTHQELQYFEEKTLQTEMSAFKNKFLHMTVQPTIIGNRIKRTKFFFGYRYMWTRCQLAEHSSYVGAGVRRDVTQAPKWVKKIENPMVEHNIVQPNFLNSVALNVYHDGSQGLAQHFDDAVRFKQPIYTLRLVSDGRLSFGSQFYGFCNGAFIIPLPRGCICVMNQNSYAANGVKHCVRPCDMSGKSAAIIMRQMHHQVVREAAKYDELIDFPAWLSSISEDPKSITFAEQKRRQSEQILNDDEKKKEKVVKPVSTDV